MLLDYLNGKCYNKCNYVFFKTSLVVPTQDRKPMSAFVLAVLMLVLGYAVGYLLGVRQGSSLLPLKLLHERDHLEEVLQKNKLASPGLLV